MGNGRRPPETVARTTRDAERPPLRLNTAGRHVNTEHLRIQSFELRLGQTIGDASGSEQLDVRARKRNERLEVLREARCLLVLQGRPRKLLPRLHTAQLQPQALTKPLLPLLRRQLASRAAELHALAPLAHSTSSHAINVFRLKRQERRLAFGAHEVGDQSAQATTTRAGRELILFPACLFTGKVRKGRRLVGVPSARPRQQGHARTLRPGIGV